jgi:hypothetical protein
VEDPRAGEDALVKGKNLAPTGNRTQIVQPVASHFTCYRNMKNRAVKIDNSIHILFIYVLTYQPKGQLQCQNGKENEIERAQTNTRTNQFI